jgi:hypothetical protein
MARTTIRTEDITDSSVQSLKNRNLIINGAMQVAQRGTSFTADNSYTLDRWKSGDGTGGTPARTLSKETFTLGQTDVPNAYYYLRHNQTSASTNGNSSLSQRIEDLTRFDGQTVTLSFYAKADSSINIDVRLIQNFGTGGSPSSNVQLTETVNIGTSWAKYTVTKTLGSLLGKTLGTDGVHTSFLNLDIEFKPTATFIFDATLFQLEYGNVDTPFEHRSYGEELALCQRYYTEATPQMVHAYSSTEVSGKLSYPMTMRATPTGTIKSGTAFVDPISGASIYPSSINITVYEYGLNDSMIISRNYSGLTTNKTYWANTTSMIFGMDAEL